MRTVLALILLSWGGACAWADPCADLTASAGPLIGSGTFKENDATKPIDIQIERGEHSVFAWNKVGDATAFRSIYEHDRVMDSTFTQPARVSHFELSVLVDDGDMLSLKPGDVSHYRESRMMNGSFSALAQVTRTVLGVGTREISGCKIDTVQIRREYVVISGASNAITTVDFAPAFGVPLHMLALIHLPKQDRTQEWTVETLKPK